MTFKQWIALGLACLAFSNSAYADTNSSVAEGAEKTKGFLWEIKSGAKTGYLFGSIHLAKPDFYPMSPAVETAYKNAKILAVETDVTDMAALKKVMPLTMYVAPDKLEKHLSAQTWAQLSTSFGPAAEQMQQLKPGIVATGLMIGMMTSTGYTADAGIDLHFLKRAKADGKSVYQLETLAFQMKVLTDFSDAEGDEMLSYTIASMKDGDAIKDSEAMVAAWKSGDLPALEKIMQSSADKDASTAKLMKRLLDDRNIGMSDKLIKLINGNKPVLIVVGAGHMVGKNSILDLLQQRGLQIRRLQ